MSQQIRILTKIITYLGIVWSLVILLFLANNIWIKYNDTHEAALNEAKLSVKKDLAFRTWIASHGGIYVPITKKTPPSPYLSHIKNRNVKTTDNNDLTLMNPAYALSQLMKDSSYKSKNKITSTVLLNPQNAPDKWENKALHIIEKTRKLYSEKQNMDNEDYIRALNPLVTKESCLKCHGFQGYKVGDIRGGVSVSVALEPYYKKAIEDIRPILIELIILWLLGMMGLLFSHKRLKVYIDDKIRSYEENIYALVDMIEERDSYTAGHSKRVAKYCVLIAQEMGSNEDDVDLLRRAAMLHDIGKISTPDSILLKPGRLNELEHNIIKEHVDSGYELLKKIDFYSDLAEIMRHHHEHYDGSGYPARLKGESIPILSQIMSVADSFDAMTTNRIYKGRMDLKAALQEIQDLSAKQFHPKIAYATLSALANVTIHNDINQVPKTRLEKERFSYFYKDHLTQAYNFEYLKFILSKKDDEAFLYQKIVTISLHNFSDFNKNFSWEEGDSKLLEVAKVLLSTFPHDLLFRVQGDDFILISRNSLELQKVQDVLKDIFVDTPISLSYKEMDFNVLTDNTLKNVKTIF